jgi:hypothetical protein
VDAPKAEREEWFDIAHTHTHTHTRTHARTHTHTHTHTHRAVDALKAEKEDLLSTCEGEGALKEEESERAVRRGVLYMHASPRK